jgi:hypothetical protein
LAQGGGEAIDVGTLDDRGLDMQPDVKDFMTIDWTYYIEKDRERRMADMVGSRRSAIYKAFYRCQSFEKHGRNTEC